MIWALDDLHTREVAYLCDPHNDSRLMFAWDMGDWVVLNLEKGRVITIPFEITSMGGMIHGQTTIEYGTPKAIPKETARSIWNSLMNCNWLNPSVDKDKKEL